MVKTIGYIIFGISMLLWLDDSGRSHFWDFQLEKLPE